MKCIKKHTAIILLLAMIISLFSYYETNAQESEEEVYHITYELDSGINSADNPSEYTTGDSDITLAEPTKPGCSFDGWYTSDTFNTKVTTIKTNTRQDITLFAKWIEKDIVYSILSETARMGYDTDSVTHFYMSFPTSGKVSFRDSNHSSNYGGGYKLDSDTYTGTFITAKANASELSGQISGGSHFIYFDGWGNSTVSYTYYPLCQVYYMYENTQKKLTSYYLTYNSSKLLLNKPEIKGYRVLDLYRDRDLTSPIKSIDTSVGKNWCLYPKVEPITYSVSYDMDGGTNNNENISSYTIEDSDFVLKKPVKTGYIFDGWYTTPALTTKTTTITTSDCKDITLYAKWTKQTYPIEYVDAFTHDNPKTYTISDKKILLTPATGKAGYEFEGWYLDKEHTQKINNIDTSKCEPITLYGGWVPSTFQIKYELNGGINAPDNITEYTSEDSDFVLKKPSKAGYNFDGWYTSNTFETKITTIHANTHQNITLYAKWLDKDIKYFITSDSCKCEPGNTNWTFSFPTNGKITFSKQGNTANFLLDSEQRDNTVYNIAEYNGSITAGNHTLSIGTTYENVSVSYKFIPECNVYYMFENMPIKLTSYLLTDISTQITLSYPEIKGYYVLGMYRDRALTDKIESIDKSLGKDWYLYPKTEPISYSVFYDMDGGTNNDTNIAEYTIEDPDFSLEEPIKPGYSFDGWYSSPSFDTRVEKIVTDNCEDITLYAKWTKILANTPKPSEPDTTAAPIPDTTSSPAPDITTSPALDITPSPDADIPQQANDALDLIGTAISLKSLPSSALDLGSVYIDANGYKYRLVGYKALQYCGSTTSCSTVNIPNTITLQGKKYSIVSISANAFTNNKSLKTVVIGKNIKQIGKKAFYKCKKLKKVIIRTKKLTKKTIGSKAFAGIHPNAVFQVPKSKRTQYQKILSLKSNGKKINS